MPEELTSSQLEAQINAIQPQTETQQPARPQVAETKETPEPVQSGQVSTEPQGQAQPASEATPQPPPQTELKSADSITLEALMKEKGTVNPDEIAKSYKEAQKKLTQLAQENARLRNQEPAQQPQAVQPNPVDSMDVANQRFVQDLAQNPLMTIAKVVRAISEEQVKPFAETQKQALLNQEIMRLSGDPETRNTFNLKPVQTEIQKVLEENPDYLVNLPKNLATVHDIALGRLARKGFSLNVQTQISGQQPVPVDGRNKPSPPQTIDFNKASSGELEAYINSLPQGS